MKRQRAPPSLRREKRGSIAKSIDKLASLIASDEANSAESASSGSMMLMMLMLQMQQQHQQQLQQMQQQQAFMQSQMDLQMRVLRRGFVRT
jgi:hypothetical protein